MPFAKNILVLAPHTDDGELGCGATLAKYAAAGYTIHYVAFSSCAQSLPPSLPADTLIQECRAATTQLGVGDLRFFDFPVRDFAAHRQTILEQLVVLNKEIRPDLVFLPALGDVHQDHQVIAQEGQRAFKFCTLLAYELPWNNTRFQPNYFELITPQQLAAKQDALQNYASQRHRSYMQPSFIQALALVRGVQAGGELAEAFEVIKMVRPS